MQNSLSFWSLIAVNFIALIAVIVQKVTFGEVVWAFWGQGIIIVAFQWLKLRKIESFNPGWFFMLKNRSMSKDQVLTLMSVYYLLVFSILLGNYAFTLTTYSFVSGADLINTNILWLTGLFFVHHLISYKHHLHEKSSYPQTIWQGFGYPLMRLLPLHISMLSFGVWGDSLRNLAFYMFLKLVIDQLAFLWEHAKTKNLWFLQT